MKPTQIIKLFTCITLFILLTAAGLVFLFDPFFHYHQPIAPLKEVLTKKEYQVPGTLRNFTYDSVIAGSSTAENFNNHWFDETFGVTSVKAIKSSGVTAQLDYYLNMAFEEKEVTNVFYSLDLFALGGDPQLEFPDESMPLYLYDQNTWNDVKYLLNKDIIFEDIPYMIATTFIGEYDEGTSYNWAQYKTFGRAEALNHYERPEIIKESIKKEEYQPLVDGNVDLLEQMVRNHPETTFYFFYPPYSLLWWDNMMRSGQLEQSLYAAQTSMERLLVYENVKLYNFQTEKEIVMNLDLFMDPVHFTAETNHWMVEEMGKDNYRVNVDNHAEIMDGLWMMTEEIRVNYDQLIQETSDEDMKKAALP